ncbi:hypothetical protein BpHYR1_008545 [Brachionus plicatilis]|uniref:Uncharacterized protein n=1 Tax=Brachionus plicatilis TaxID=10195 RepID=A0A3M7T4U0_BRAPC|nr:hypothetical protein BpHYR1_008545 [Brachionus plicatilis]
MKTKQISFVKLDMGYCFLTRTIKHTIFCAVFIFLFHGYIVWGKNSEISKEKIYKHEYFVEMKGLSDTK